MIWMIFISFSCLNFLASISRCYSTPVLNKSGHPCLASHLRGKAFNLHYWVCYCGLVKYGSYYVEFLTMNEYCILPKSCIYWDGNMILSFILLIYILLLIEYVEPFLYPRDKSCEYTYFLRFYWIQFASNFVENFSICIYQRYWPVIFFSCSILVWLRYLAILALYNEFESVPSSFQFDLLEEFEKDGVSFSLHSW